MKFEINKRLCTLSIVCALAFTPVMAQEEYSQNILEGFVQESRMTDITDEYISKVEELLNNQIDSDSFETAEKTANYLVDITKKHYGKRSEKTAQALVARAKLYRSYFMPDKAFKDLSKAETLIKRNSDNNNLKIAVNSEYAKLYSKIDQPLDGIKYLEKITDDMYGDNIENLAHKYEYTGKLYAKSSEYKKAIENYNTAIDKIKLQKEPNKYDLMGIYSQISDISNPKEAVKAIDKLTAVANSFPSDDVNPRIDAKLKRLQFYDRMSQISSHKKQLDELNALVQNNTNPYREMSLTWLYLSYYSEQNNSAMVKKYREIADKYNSEMDWNKVPADSLLFIKKYQNEIVENFDNPEKAKKLVNEALKKFDSKKEHIPVLYSKLLIQASQVNLSTGDYIEAENYLKKAEQILTQMDAEPKYKIASLYDNYSEYYRALDNINTSLDYADKAANIYADLKGGSSEEVLKEYMKQADLYMQIDNSEEASKCIDKYVDSVKQVYGENNIKTYDAMFNAYLFYKNIDEKKSQELYKKISYDLKQNKIQGMYPALFYSLYIIEARNAIDKKQYKTAAQYAEKAVKYAHDKEQKYHVYGLLAQLYSGMAGKKALSQKYKKLKSSLK